RQNTFYGIFITKIEKQRPSPRFIPSPHRSNTHFLPKPSQKPSQIYQIKAPNPCFDSQIQNQNAESFTSHPNPCPKQCFS
ncbi:hypothetical protein, partial [Pseudochrobactrum sp. B5]|uniref:hypothetical protein n=1 Tax=Pseudochrobactrum sp. B5 TaxID=1289478 RepID=UPI001AECC298